MEKFDTIIIGAGASGMMCALNTKSRTLLLEASDRIGKKILATGNGKCNITNNMIDAKFYNTPLVQKYFQNFNQVQTLQYFEKLGVFTYPDEAGRRYPLSNSANTVLDVLVKALSLKKNVQTVVNAIPTLVAVTNNGFQVNTQNQTYLCRQLVVATGGNSGTQYLNQLNVKYQPFTPSLMGLKTTKNKGLAGVRVSNVRVKCNQFDEVGEILFKEDGISGIVIFNLSAYLARNKIVNGKIMIDLLPEIKNQTLLTMLQSSIKNNPRYSLIEILEGFLHKSLAKNLLEKLSLERTLAQDCNEENISRLAGMMKSYVVNFTGYSDNNQVYTGGIDLTQLDDHLQSKQIPGLYFIGEVVNVDGACGGYNLQWAWTSGKIVGDSL